MPEVLAVNRAAALFIVGAILIASLAIFFGNSVARRTDVRDRMLNAIDHYSSLEATYLHRLLATTDDQERQLTVDILRNPGVGAQATLTRADGGVVTYVTDGSRLVQHDLVRDEYTVAFIAKPAVPQRAFSAWDRLRILFKKGKDAANAIVLRQEVTELPLGWVSTALFPQEWVLGTYDVSQVIDQGQEELLGRMTHKLKVVAPDARRIFVVNVDQETGVLLRTEIIESGRVSDVIEATRFQVNRPIDQSRFAIPDLTGKNVRTPG